MLPGRPSDHGGVARDNRFFVSAVWYVAKTGIPWRDLPARFGNPYPRPAKCAADLLPIKPRGIYVREPPRISDAMGGHVGVGRFDQRQSGIAE